MRQDRNIGEIDGKPVFVIGYRGPAYAVVIDCDEQGYTIDQAGRLIGSERRVLRDELNQRPIRTASIDPVAEALRGTNNQLRLRIERLRLCGDTCAALAAARRVVEWYERLSEDLIESPLLAAGVRERLPEVERLLQSLTETSRRISGGSNGDKEVCTPETSP